MYLFSRRKEEGAGQNKIYVRAKRADIETKPQATMEIKLKRNA